MDEVEAIKMSDEEFKIMVMVIRMLKEEWTISVRT